MAMRLEERPDTTDFDWLDSPEPIEPRPRRRYPLGFRIAAGVLAAAALVEGAVFVAAYSSRHGSTSASKPSTSTATPATGSLASPATTAPVTAVRVVPVPTSIPAPVTTIAAGTGIVPPDDKRITADVNTTIKAVAVDVAAALVTGKNTDPWATFLASEPAGTDTFQVLGVSITTADFDSNVVIADVFYLGRSGLQIAHLYLTRSSSAHPGEWYPVHLWDLTPTKIGD